MQTFDQVVQDLTSQDLVVQVSALDQARTIFGNLCTASARSLLHVDPAGRLAVAEKIFALGPGMIPALEELLGQDVDQEVRTHVALMLLKWGSRAGVNQLIMSLKENVGPVGAIAQSLSAAGISEAAEAIRSALDERVERNDLYTAVSMVEALGRLHAEEPTRVLARIRALSPSVAKALEAELRKI